MSGLREVEARLEGAPDARLDPWCLVPLPGRAEYLFGFAAYHSGTGGLSWMRSSPLELLDQARGRAITESGRLYELGRRTEPTELRDPEGKAAFRLLTGTSGDCREEAPLLSAWLTACKIARWIAAQPPPCCSVEVERFITKHRQAYKARRLGRRLS
jgi:hypothetical protein